MICNFIHLLISIIRVIIEIPKKVSSSMKKIKNMLSYNLKTLIGFEAIYKLLSTLIFLPLFLSIFNLIVKITGFNYLTFENIFSFLANPLTLLMLLILLVLIAFYSLIDISTIIIILDSSYHHQKISIKEAFLLACKKSLKVFHKKYILISIIPLFLIPFLNLGISSSFISTITIPEFILDFIKANRTLSIIYALIVIILIFIFLKWLYTIHYFILEDKTFKEAHQKSTNLSKKSLVKDFIFIILTQSLIALTYFLFVFLGITLIIVLYKNFSNSNLFGNISITAIWLLIALSFIIIVLLSTPISYACISSLYYHHKEKNKESITPLKINYKEITKNKSKLRFFKYALIILILTSGTIFTYLVVNNKFNLNLEYERLIEVTAHRGASINYPENTMLAFEKALELGADWIELDVQQTKDGKIIVMHDTNLKRTTGVSKNTWEVTYEEIKDLDAGSFLDPKFNNARIPLLEEVIKFAKANHIKLNIELKPTGKEKDFEKSVVALIKEYNFQNECVITSQVYDVLVNAKKASSDIKTVYVMSLAYGDIMSLKEADAFSIEASSATKTLINNVHKENKELYVWTVNTKENIEKTINLNVDNIITDNISLAKELIFDSKTGNLINEYVKYINKLF